MISPSHLYVHLLSKNLLKVSVRPYQIETSARPRLLLFPLQIAFLRPRAQVLHLHWIEFLFRTRSRSGPMLSALALFAMLQILCIAKFVIRYKIVTTLHNVEPHEKLFPQLQRTGFKAALRLSDAVIAHNIFTLESARRLYGVKRSQLEIIPHGNFIGAYPNKISQLESRALLGIDPERVVFTFVGGLRMYKGVDLLLQAFERALQHNHNVHLIIAGDPTDRTLAGVLSSYKQANLTFVCRYLRDDEFQVFINAADFGVLPYRAVTTPGSLLLFLSFGKPIIAPDIAPVREIARDDFAILFRANDVESLKNALLLACSVREKALTMGQMGFNQVSTYDWLYIATKTRRLYEEMSSQRT